MTEKKCCGCGIVHPIEVMVLWKDLWLCFGCHEVQENNEIVLDIEIPSFDEMEKMSLGQLKKWAKKLGPYYSKRFEMDHEDYMKIMRYIAFSMMIENIEKGIDKWTRIDRERMKA